MHTKRTVIGLVIAFTSCTIIATLAAITVGWFIEMSGRGKGPNVAWPPIFIIEIIVVTLLCFWILAFLLRKFYASHRGWVSWVVVIFISLSIGIVSTVVGKAPYMHFLKGLEIRASEELNYEDVIDWADSVFGSNLDLGESPDAIQLHGTNVPSFIDKMFQGTPPNVVVTFSSRRVPICMHIYDGGGFARWGIAVFNTNSTPNSEAMEYRKIDKRLYVFHSK